MIHKGDFSLADRNPNDKIVHHTLKGSCSGLLDASLHPGWSGQMVVLSKWKSRCRGVDNEDMLHSSHSSDWGNTYSWQKKQTEKISRTFSMKGWAVEAGNFRSSGVHLLWRSDLWFVIHHKGGRSHEPSAGSVSGSSFISAPQSVICAHKSNIITGNLAGNHAHINHQFQDFYILSAWQIKAITENYLVPQGDLSQ